MQPLLPKCLPPPKHLSPLRTLRAYGITPAAKVAPAVAARLDLQLRVPRLLVQAVPVVQEEEHVLLMTSDFPLQYQTSKKVAPQLEAQVVPADREEVQVVPVALVLKVQVAKVPQLVQVKNQMQVL